MFDYEDDELTRSEDLSARGSVYACDPASANWQTRAKMPVKKSNYSLVSFNDRVYVIGGFTGPNVPSSSVEEYDPQSDRWILRKSMPTARGRIGVVVLRGRIYALGGKTGDRLTTDAVEEYNPAADTWAVKHRLSRPLMGVHAAAADGKIYKLKGTHLSEKGSFEMIMDFEAYDPTGDVWAPKAQWTFEKEPLEAVAVGGRFFAVGGGMFTDASAHSLKEYDIASDKWVFRRDMPEANSHTIHFTWAVVDGKIYTFGGGHRAGSSWRASNHAQRYDPDTDKWEELPPLAGNRIGMGVAVVGNKIFLVGGETTGASVTPGQRNPLSDSMEVYEIKGVSK